MHRRAARRHRPRPQKAYDYARRAQDPLPPIQIGRQWRFYRSDLSPAGSAAGVDTLRRSPLLALNGRSSAITSTPVRAGAPIRAKQHSSGSRGSTERVDDELVGSFCHAANRHEVSDTPAGVWDQWGRITRFLESARLAFARERNLWTSLELEAVDDVKLSAPTGQGSYRVALAQHLRAVEDEDTLLGAVLIHSYAIAEAAASDRLSVPARDLGGMRTGARDYSPPRARPGTHSRAAWPAPSRSPSQEMRAHTAPGASITTQRGVFARPA